MISSNLLFDYHIISINNSYSNSCSKFKGNLGAKKGGEGSVCNIYKKLIQNCPNPCTQLITSDTYVIIPDKIVHKT